jgi:hypothetical protein
VPCASLNHAAPKKSIIRKNLNAKPKSSSSAKKMIVVDILKMIRLKPNSVLVILPLSKNGDLNM